MNIRIFDYSCSSLGESDCDGKPDTVIVWSCCITSRLPYIIRLGDISKNVVQY